MNVIFYRANKYIFNTEKAAIECCFFRSLSFDGFWAKTSIYGIFAAVKPLALEDVTKRSSIRFSWKTITVCKTLRRQKIRFP